MKSTEDGFRGVKKNTDVLVKDPFHCTNDTVSMSKGVCLVGKKRFFERLLEAEDKQIVFLFLYDAKIKSSSY